MGDFKFNWSDNRPPIETEPARPFKSKIPGNNQIIDARSRLWSYFFKLKTTITYLPLAYIYPEHEVHHLYQEPKQGFKMFSKKATIFSYIIEWCKENKTSPEIFDWDLIKEMSYYAANYVTVKRCGDLNG